jgi:hypothetical protein
LFSSNLLFVLLWSFCRLWKPKTPRALVNVKLASAGFQKIDSNLPWIGALIVGLGGVVLGAVCE